MAIHKPNHVPILHSVGKDKMEWFEKSITNITSLTYLPHKINLGYRAGQLRKWFNFWHRIETSSEAHPV